MAVSTKLVSGFECEFVEKPIKAFQTECLICLLVLREPYQVICCGKSFCRSCIGRVKTLNKKCPHCNKPNFNNFPNKGLQQSLYQLKVQCTHQKEGCKWTGELGTLDNHLNLDPQPANKLEGCVFVMVKCTHCSESHQRQHINHHQSEVCPKRPFTCEHCKDYNSTFEDVTTNHWSVCGCYPVECPNKCSAVLQRQNIKSHVAKDCPLTEIKCDFHCAGCEVKLPRKDMGEHLCVELVTHMSMIAASYQQQDQDQQRMGELMIKQLILLAIENQTKAKENEALKQRVSELEKKLEVLEREQKTDRGSINSIYDVMFIPPVDIIMPNFKQYKKNNDFWYSPPFYTHHRGYKLCIECYANGYIYEKGTHVSVFFHMMRGEFDDELKWPFRGEVTVQLLRRDGSYHSKTIKLNTIDCCSRVTKGDIGDDGLGESRFISHDDCNKHCVKKNSLHFRIASVKLLY